MTALARAGSGFIGDELWASEHVPVEIRLLTETAACTRRRVGRFSRIFYFAVEEASQIPTSLGRQLIAAEARCPSQRWTYAFHVGV